MPVDKFGRMDEVIVGEDGISISYVNDNFLRKDGTSEVTGSINMNGNTLTRVSNPVNSQDVATKDYVDSSSGLLRENGDYHILGNLNMGFNKIKNLRDPTEPSEAVNKKYVDESGKAFVYSNGEYLATSEVNMGGRRIDNIATPLEENQAANKNYVDLTVLANIGGQVLTRNPDNSFTANGAINMNGKRITNLPEPYGNYDPVTKFFLTKRLLSMSAHIINEYRKEIPKPVISIHAEEQGPLTKGNYEFSFGNGCSGRAHALGGYCMSSSGRIIRASVAAVGAKDYFLDIVRLGLVINGIRDDDYVLIKGAGRGCDSVVFNKPLELNANDIINFITLTDNPSVKNSYVTLLIELDL